MKELVFATHNSHKAEEIQSILERLYKIIDLKQLDFTENVPEDKDTLEGNASLKAQYIFKIFSKDCFADDTGLEVDCLNGAPGVFSARYSEMSGDRHANESISEANIRKLLRQMEGEKNRKARFRTVICLILDRKEHFFEGVVQGVITTEKMGKQGFGYDPVFLPDGCKQTFAEMSLGEKNTISHRARAVSSLVKFLQEGAIQ